MDDTMMPPQVSGFLPDSEWVVKRMTAYQERMRLSDERLGSELGKTRSTIHRWRTGHTIPPAMMLWLSIDSLERKVGLKGGRWNGEGRWEYDSDPMPPF
jgi:hypothetical protein